VTAVITTTGQCEYQVVQGDATGSRSPVMVDTATSTIPPGPGRDAVGEAVSQVAFVDFTAMDDGDPAAALDSGQSVDFVFNAGGRKPVVSAGRLVVNNQAGAGSGGLADYYQSDLGSAVTRVGVEFTMPVGSDDGNGNATYAAWDGIYEGGGTNVPRSWVHMSIVPGTGATGTAKWFVCNGIGNLFVVKQQTFTNPAADGVTRWRCESLLDANNGVAYSILPDGSVMSLTDAEIASMCATLSISAFTFADCESSVIMCEHYCSTGASAAKFAGFTSLFGETEALEPEVHKFKTLTPKLLATVLARLKSSIPASPSSAIYAPTTALTVASTTSAANVDGTNAKIITTAGPTGRVIYHVSAYYEWSTTDVLFWRLAGTVNTTTRAADVGVSGQKRLVTQTIEISGRTPGESLTESLQHWSASNGSATCKAGGSGGGMLPPITILAIPA
jgi:hypothetical protein